MERGDRLVGIAAAAGCVAEAGEGVRTLAVVVDPELERRPVASGGVFERERRRRRLGREQVVLHGPLQPADRRAGGVVVCERREPRTAVAARGPAGERLGDAQVELGLPHGRQPVCDRATNELVGEPVRDGGAELLDEKAAADTLVECLDQSVAGDDLRPAQRLEVELRARDSGELEHRPRLGRMPREPLADDLPHGRRASRARPPAGRGARRSGLSRSRPIRGARATARSGGTRCRR